MANDDDGSGFLPNLSREDYMLLLEIWDETVRKPPAEFIQFLQDQAARRRPDEKYRKISKPNIRGFVTGRLSLVATDGEVSHKRLVNCWQTFVGTYAWGHYKGKAVAWFVFQGERHYVGDWRDVVSELCALVAAENPRTFHRARGLIIGARGKQYAGRCYIAGDRSLLTDPRRITGTDLYVETNLSANNAVAFCWTLLRFFGYTLVEDNEKRLFFTSVDEHLERSKDAMR